MRSALALVALLLFAAASVAAQGPKAVRWKDGAPGSTSFEHNGVVVKRLSQDGVVVRASVVDGVSVSFTIDNQRQTPVEIRPERVTLDVTRPRSKSLAYMTPEQAGESAVALEYMRASQVEFSGSMATTMVTDPTTMEMKTVPDDFARWNARTQATTIRNGAEFERRRVLAAALKPTTLGPNESVSGTVYFERDKDPKEVLLRVPIADLVVEIPYTASKKRLVLWVKINEFE